MRDIDPGKLEFFHSTEPQPCAYLPGRVERRAVTGLSGPNSQRRLDLLNRAGFRRGHGVAYRPACPGCSACVPVRVAAAEFAPSRSLRRAAARNADLRARERPPHATLEQYGVFASYQRLRHGGDMAEMSFGEYRSLVEDTEVDTRVVEFRDGGGRLAAAAITDWLADGLSGVYNFFSVDRARASPGAYAVLWHVARARALGLPYVYLGYWVAGSRKMAWKARFRPLEALSGGRWRRFDPTAFPQPVFPATEAPEGRPK